jgi:hypothetical protein
MTKLNNDDKKIISEFINFYFNENISYNDLNTYEKDIYGKSINLIMDGEHFDFNFLNNDNNKLNITINGGYMSLIKKINIDYIFSAFGNYFFPKNFLGHLIENFSNNNNNKINNNNSNNSNYNNQVKILSLQTTKLSNRFYLNNKQIQLIDLEHLKKSENSNDILHLLKFNYENNYECLKRCHKEKCTELFKLDYTYNQKMYRTIKKKFKLCLSSGILTILYLLKLKCKIYINGFNFNLLGGKYHRFEYYKYTENEHYRLSMDSANLKHLKQERFMKGVEQDKYVLYLLKFKYFNDKIFLQNNLYNALKIFGLNN